MMSSPGLGARSKVSSQSNRSGVKNLAEIRSEASTIVAIGLGIAVFYSFDLKSGPGCTTEVVPFPKTDSETSSTFRTREEVPWRYRI
jgi:hypothetical protein